MALYAATIFLSAFLLFQVQPLLGKWILPWFGGTPAAWTACMLFFQLVLLGGYAYAHWIRTRLPERRQLLVHVLVLAGALALLPIGPSAAWKPQGEGDPTWHILALLAAGVGLPYFALSATSPLLQAWFAAAYPGASPYRLYALSNAGSLLALASYPFVIEPSLRLKTQAAAWSGGFGLFAVLCAACALPLWRGVPRPSAAVRESVDPGMNDAEPGRPPEPPEPPEGRPGPTEGPPTRGARVLWLLLPACGSVLLLATTNQMCADVGVVPFLWVLPLALYLLSFILVFDREGVYQRAVFYPLLLLAVAGMTALLWGNVYVAIHWQVLGYSAGLFVCCMVCHGEFARLKPAPRHLTAFFLASAAGGALGGVFVSLAAPRVFRGYFELHLGLWACLGLAIVAFMRERPVRQRWPQPWAAPAFAFASMVILIGAAMALIGQGYDDLRESLDATRNFYGVLRVRESASEKPKGRRRDLVHGRILHGCQFQDDALRRQPVTYFGPGSGIGLAMEYLRGQDRPLKLGIAGLGIGTLAAYGREGDEIRFYEINADVKTLAESRFTYLSDCPAAHPIILGDARLSLEREDGQQFDLLALDAFTSDAVPVHLLTTEACAIYKRHLKPGGILAFNISNRFLDLRPVILALGAAHGLEAAIVDASDDDARGLFGSRWVLLTTNREFLDSEEVQAGGMGNDPSTIRPLLWTDDYSNLFSVVSNRE